MTYDGLDYENKVHHDDCSPSYLAPLISASTVILDVGCGTGRKVLPFYAQVDQMYLLDSSNSMLSVARAHMNDLGASNCHAMLGSSFYLPLESNTCSIVSSMLSPYSLMEIYRVLKPGGHIFLELLGALDKRQLKEAFGKDDLGWRGILMNQSTDYHENSIRRSLSPFFVETRVSNVRRHVTMTLDSLYQILVQTPTIRNFGGEKDFEIAASVFGIKPDQKTLVTLEDHRLIVVASKPG
jgi:ubiquinone/menaquinone biosynthesis C-methylase UbiE